MGDQIEDFLTRNQRDTSNYCSRLIPKGDVIEIGKEGTLVYTPKKK